MEQSASAVDAYANADKAGIFSVLFAEKTRTSFTMPKGGYNAKTRTYISDSGERVFGAECSGTSGVSEYWSGTSGDTCKTDDHTHDSSSD